MTCRDFEHAWQAHLDDGSSAIGDEAVEVHAASCPACRIRGERYRILAQALQAQTLTTAPSPELADRILARFEAEPRDPIVRLTRFSMPGRARWGAAAAVLIAGGLALWSLTPREHGPDPLPASNPIARPLSAALTDATTATLDLALATSTPAARLGRMVLDNATVAEPGPDDAESIGPGPAGEILKSVSDRMATGVKPISGKARRAFGFLLNPSPAERPAEPSSERGRGA